MNVVAQYFFLVVAFFLYFIGSLGALLLSSEDRHRVLPIHVSAIAAGVISIAIGTLPH